MKGNDARRLDAKENGPHSKSHAAASTLMSNNPTNSCKLQTWSASPASIAGVTWRAGHEIQNSPLPGSGEWCRSPL